MNSQKSQKLNSGVTKNQSHDIDPKIFQFKNPDQSATGKISGFAMALNDQNDKEKTGEEAPIINCQKHSIGSDDSPISSKKFVIYKLTQSSAAQKRKEEA